jgi:SAM-dependent methyltransferase
MGFEVSWCDAQPSFFAGRDLTVTSGDIMNKHRPYEAERLDCVSCLDGLEHAGNPFNAIEDLGRVIKKGRKLLISIPNYLNIERRMRFLIPGVFSRLAPRSSYRDALRGCASMLHLNQMGYPVFRVIKLDIDRPKPKLKYFLPLVWLIRFYRLFWPKETRESYFPDGTLSDQILMGGNTLNVIGEREGGYR